MGQLREAESELVLTVVKDSMEFTRSVFVKEAPGKSRKRTRSVGDNRYDVTSLEYPTVGGFSDHPTKVSVSLAISTISHVDEKDTRAGHGYTHRYIRSDRSLVPLAKCS